ncbi:hypothetical protein MMC26_005860 [Xylographa opegraphella]|nr:hypothetical protein [Xylographa opegraphella]
MATGQRGFRELDISVSSVLSAHERFPPFSDRPDPPEIFRNTLTALSQYHNLYFLAIGADLFIYKPQYPSQRINSHPDLVITLPYSQYLPGCVNPNNPHAVNHLKVGDLGDEELLVCACDDGDVIVLTTRSLAYELEQREAGRSEHTSTLRPFFYVNVGMSAWGIAIHKEARLIAISANTHTITVFAFALRQENSPDPAQRFSQEFQIAQDIEDGISGGEDGGWRQAGPEGLSHDRSRDQCLVLYGHSCNIPNISFCNTEDDPTGRYLISMDIEGTVAVWRIFEGNYQYYTSQQIAEEHGIPFPHNAVWHGWNILCLNPRSFRPLRREAEIFGCRAVANYGDRSWDITRSQQEVTDSSMWHPRSNVPTTTGLLPLHLDVGVRTTAEDDEGAGLDEDYHSEDEMGMDIERLRENLRPSLDLNPPRRLPANPIPLSATDTTPAADPSAAPPLPFLLLTCNTTTPTLWSPNTFSFTNLPSRHAIPATYLTHMLDQHIPISHSRIHQYNRLIMSLQIPTLGIVILASPIGRVALLTLTRQGPTNRCAFRLDWLLPFKSQENRGERPEAALLGIAVGPVQGSGPEPRRWRLMLTYHDYSVLSYEIGRGEGRADEVLIF